MTIASYVLLLADVPMARLMRGMQDLRTGCYRLLQEMFRGEEQRHAANEQDNACQRLFVLMRRGFPAFFQLFLYITRHAVGEFVFPHENLPCIFLA